MLELDFGDEETANFGTRNESGTALFQVHTLATISNSRPETVSKLPHVQACGSPDSGFCVAADHQISVFGEGCRTCNTTLSLESVIEHAGWVGELPLLIICDRSGTVHVFHSGLNQVLFSQVLLERTEKDQREECFKEMSVVEDEQGNYLLLLLTSRGTLFRFANLNLRKLDQVIQNGDFAAAKQLQSQITVDETDLSEVHTDGVNDLTAISIAGQLHLVTVGGGDYVLAIWKYGAQIKVRRRLKSNIFIAGKFLKCRVSGKYIFAVDEEHKLSCWSPSLMLVYVMPFKVREFTVTSDKNNNNSESVPQVQLVMLTVPDNEGCHLKVYSLPSIQCAYSLAVGPHSVLATMPDSQDTIYLVEGRSEEEGAPFGDPPSSPLVSMLMVRCLMEALPETRFQRLLHKKRYAEAEKFAQLFNLNIEPVYRSQAMALLEQASSLSSPAGLQQRTVEGGGEAGGSLCLDMITCLEKIMDVEFVVEVCSQASMPSLEDTAKLLQYARTRLSKVRGKEGENLKAQKLLALILETLHKLSSYNLLYSSSDYSSTHWDSFVINGMLSELLQHVRRGNLSRAAVVWNRHKREFAEMSPDLLKRLLDAVPGDAPSHDLILWVRDVMLPFVYQTFHQGKQIVISWIEERVTSLEVTEKAAWPGNGLELAQLVLRGNQQSLASATGAHFAHMLRETRCSEACLEGLKELVHCLTELQTLHSKYKCYLTLDQFRKETTESISYRMVERVAAPELVPRTITNCITPYAKDHKLEVDDLLLKYIKDLLSSASLCTTYEASWEAKAITVIRCMKDLTCQCEAIYALMQKALVPWSRAMEQLVQYGLGLKHPLVAQLEERYKVTELRDMFIKYDLRSVTIGVTDSMKIAVKNILSQDGPGVLDDALRVVRTYPSQLSEMDAFLFRLHHLIHTNQIDKCLCMLNEMSHETALICVTRIVSLACIILDSEPQRFFDDESKEERLLFGQAAVQLLETDLYKETCDDPLSLDQSKKLQQDVQAILHLQMEYDAIVPLSSYRDDVFRSQLLKQHVVKHFTGKHSDVQKTQDAKSTERRSRELKPGSLIRVLRLGEILGVPSNELQGEIALKAAQKGNITAALDICRELSTPYCPPDVAQTLYQVCHTICVKMAEGHEKSSHGDVVQDLLDLMQTATTSCQPELLLDCLDLCSRVRTMKRLADQCESGDYGLSVQVGAAETKKDPYQEYSFETFFEEDALVLDSQAALPTAAEFTLACQPRSRSRQALPLQQTRVAGQPVLVLADDNDEEEDGAESQASLISVIGSTSYSLCMTLREHNQFGLAFHALMKSLDTILVYISINAATRPQEDSKTSSALKRDMIQAAEFIRVSKQSMMALSSSLLNKIFSCRKVDTFLALCYLMILPAKVARDQIKKLVVNAGQNYKKVLVIAEVGCELARLDRDTGMLQNLHKLKLLASWGDRLLKMKVSFKEAFNNGELRRALLPQLIKHPETTLELFMEYCRDFSLDEQEAVMMYIEHLLLPGDADCHGNEPKPLDKAAFLSAVSQIQTKASLIKMLSSSIDKIDCYDYERLRLVMDIIEDSKVHLVDQTYSTDVGLKLLDYLEAYKRTKPPSEYEITFQPNGDTEGVQLMLTSKALSPLSKSRLPFHPLFKGGQWKILCRELSEDTFEKLLPVAEVLRLSADTLYVTTIQNIIKAKQQGQRNGSWSPENKGAREEGTRLACKLDLDSLTKVNTILLKLQDPQVAVVTAKFIAKELPLGKEKVLALKICERLACRWKEVCQEESPEYQTACGLHQHFVTERRAVCTEESLHRHGLAEPLYTQMVTKPAELIFKLYEHRSIEQRMQGVLHDVPDIGEAVQEIAAINNTNLEKIRIHLMEQWMPQPVTTKQEDTTMNFSFGGSEEEDVPEEEKSLMRLKYLLRRDNTESTALFLLNVAYKQTSIHVTPGCQVRALRCLFSLFDDTVIGKVANQSVSALREYMRSLVYLSEFEALNIAIDLPTFNNSKASLVRGLWRNHNHEPRSVRLISQLCLDYGVHDQLWNSILQQMQTFGMLDYLEYVLVQLAEIAELRSIPCLPKVWSVILAAPFMSICVPLSDQQADKCRNVLLLLQKCPVLMDLDFVRLSCQFARVEMYVETLACLLHMTERSRRESQIDALLGQRHVLVLDSLSHLRDKKQPLPEQDQVIAEVYRHIAAGGLYEVLLDTKHFMGLVHHLAKHDQLHGLVERTVKSDRISDAIKLVKVFHAYHPNSPSANCSSDTDLLKVYMSTHGLDNDAFNVLNGLEEDQ